MGLIRPTVVLADDIPASLATWENLLQGTCTVVATSPDGLSALDAIRKFKPDVAVLDINMPGLSGLDVARTAIAEQSTVGVILCSVNRDPGIIKAAAEAGVRGYVFKINLFHDLAKAVHAVVGGGQFFPLLDPSPFFESAGHAASVASQDSDAPDLRQMLQALRESEKRLRLALEANSEGVWDWNIQSGQAYFSDCYARMLGYEPEEFPTDYAEWKQLVHPEDFDRVHQAHADHIYRGKEFLVEFRMRKKTGDWCWIRSRAAVIEWDGAGTAVRMVGTHLDITERKRMEEELRNRERELQEAQRVACVGSWTRDANDVLKWSDEMYRIHGRDPGLGPPSFRELEHLFTAESWKLLKATRDSASRSGFLADQDHEIVRPDGSHRWVATRCEVECDGNGRLVRIRGTSQDITERKQAEQKLREYEQAIEGAEEMIVVVDRECRFVIANPAFLDFYGQTAERVIGRSISEIVGTKIFEEVIKKNLEQSFGGQTARFEVTFTNPGRGCRTVFATHLPIDGPNGVERVVAILQDVTQRKKAEEELLERESALREAQRIARIGNWTWDPRTDAVTWSDEIFARIGWDPKIPVPNLREHGQFFEADDFRKLNEAVQKALHSGVPYAMEMEGTSSDGKRGWFITRGEAVYAADGTVDHLRGTFQDVTEQHLAEAALRESEERFRSIADTAPVMIWMAGPDNRITYVNKQGLQFTDTTLESHLGQSWAEGIHPEDAGRAAREYNGAFERREAVTLEYRLRTHKGYRWVIDTAVPRFEAGGSFAGYIGSCVDDTDRREGEEALRGIGGRLIQAQEQERKRIARELHDDINQRLAMLAFEVQQLRATTDLSPAELDKQLGELFKQTSDISSGVQALSHQLHSSSLDYLGLARAIEGFCVELGNRHHVAIDYQHNEVPRSLSPDISLALFRITQEALQNAIKYSGVREFSVRLIGGPDQVQLTVRDMGVGFGLEGAIHGRGLGLISMRERMTALHGTLSIVSKPKQGTEITASVPLTSAM